MSNIELHSFGDWVIVVEKAIWKCHPACHPANSSETAEANFWNELVVTTFPSEARNLQKRTSPFVRVFFESGEEKSICNDILCRVPDSVKFFFEAKFNVEFVRVDRCMSVPLK